MPNLNVAKMLLKNSGKTEGRKEGQQLKDLRRAVECIISYLEKLEKGKPK